MIITQANSPHLFTNIYIKMMFFDFFSVRFGLFANIRCDWLCTRYTSTHFAKQRFNSMQFNIIIISIIVVAVVIIDAMASFMIRFLLFFWPKTILDFGLEFMAFLRFFGCSLCEEAKGSPAPSSSDFFIFASLILMFKYKSLKNCNIIFYGNLLKPDACFVLAAITLTTILAKWQYGGLVNLNTKHAS